MLGFSAYFIDKMTIKNMMEYIKQYNDLNKTEKERNKDRIFKNDIGVGSRLPL